MPCLLCLNRWKNTLVYNRLIIKVRNTRSPVKSVKFKIDFLFLKVYIIHLKKPSQQDNLFEQPNLLKPMDKKKITILSLKVRSSKPVIEPVFSISYKLACVPIKDSDQPVHPPRLSSLPWVLYG